MLYKKDVNVVGFWYCWNFIHLGHQKALHLPCLHDCLYFVGVYFAPWCRWGSASKPAPTLCKKASGRWIWTCFGEFLQMHHFSQYIPQSSPISHCWIFDGSRLFFNVDNFFIEIPFLVSFNFPLWTTFWYDFQSRCIPSNWLSYCFSIVVPKWKFSIF